jgi:cyclohexa-1,5-dienecarbonyl-CoA hydratase
VSASSTDASTEAGATGLRRELLFDGAVLRLVLDAGPGNVIDRALCQELHAAADEARDNPRLVAVVLDHEGKHFSYGASVEQHAPEEVGRMLPTLHAAARALVTLDVPLVAVVRGLCLGGGLELAALADRIVSHPGARFGQPEIQLGVFAPIASALLPRLIGPRPATDLLITGRTLSAEEAHTRGLVAELAEDPAGSALAWVSEHLLPRSASSLRFAVAAARRSWRAGFLSDLEEHERVYLEQLMATHDAPEGIAAFLEKREARWEHR